MWWKESTSSLVTSGLGQLCSAPSRPSARHGPSAVNAPPPRHRQLLVRPNNNLCRPTDVLNTGSPRGKRPPVCCAPAVTLAAPVGSLPTTGGIVRRSLSPIPPTPLGACEGSLLSAAGTAPPNPPTPLSPSLFKLLSTLTPLGPPPPLSWSLPCGQAANPTA